MEGKDGPTLNFWEITSDHFERTLRRVFEGTQIDPASVRKVASLGCGTFMEARGLRKFFLGAEIEGIDRDGLSFSTIRSKKIIPADVNLRNGDLTDRALLGNGQYDVLVVRNPDVYRKSNWKQVFSNMAASLKDGGIVVVTGMTDVETEQSRGLMEGVGMSILIDEPNANAIPDEMKVPARDSYLVVGRKP